jgi:hypothetical protein
LEPTASEPGTGAALPAPGSLTPRDRRSTYARVGMLLLFIVIAGVGTYLVKWHPYFLGRNALCDQGGGRAEAGSGP